MRTKINALLLLGLLLFNVSCSKDSEETTPEAIAISNLVYAPNTLTTQVGVEAQSVMPTLSGTKPYTFSLTSTPDHGGKLSITSDGVIKAAADLAHGTYVVDVSVSNSVGNLAFPSAYTVTAFVGESKSISFAADVKPLVEQKCATCHTTAGGVRSVLNDYATAKERIDKMIELTTSGSMPKNGTALTPAEIKILTDWKAGGLNE